MERVGLWQQGVGSWLLARPCLRCFCSEAPSEFRALYFCCSPVFFPLVVGRWAPCSASAHAALQAACRRDGKIRWPRQPGLPAAHQRLSFLRHGARLPFGARGLGVVAALRQRCREPRAGAPDLASRVQSRGLGGRVPLWGPAARGRAAGASAPAGAG